MDENNSKNMTEETNKFPVNMLTAEELLKNRGIKCHAWDEYERSIKTLPKTGMKQFEPDNSWLQNMQLEKGIITRKNLLAVERVDRISQLASAEWLHVQKRAKVKKHSGQDWSSFGLEKNGALYLIPEEALFLLEANCLELTWNNVPLSIQQAYDLLIDNIECSLEEYRVYSQLVRFGYHIQRFVYASERNVKYDESVNPKRKVIVEPENGLWMVDTQENKNCIDTDSKISVNSPEGTNMDSIKLVNSPEKSNIGSEKRVNCPEASSMDSEISLNCPGRISMDSSVPVDCPQKSNMDSRISVDCPERSIDSEKVDCLKKLEMTEDDTDASIEIIQNVTEQNDVVNDVREVLNNLLGKIENIEVQSESVDHESNTENCTKLNTEDETVDINGTNRKRTSRAEIISEETLLCNIKIVKDPSSDYSKEDKMLNWRGSRIQRNVKLLPKRTDKVPASDISVIDSNTKTLEHCLGKHKSSSITKENSPIKRSKQEIIELSDDEVQEVPKPMTRMDILNLIPNIALQSTITIKVSRGYIPHSIKPHKTVYHYESSKLKNLQQTDKRLQPNKNVENSNTNQKALQYYSSSMNNVRRNTNIVPFHQNVTNVQNVFLQDYFSVQQAQHTNFNPNYLYTNRLPFMYNQSSYWHHRNTMFQNMFVAVENHSTAIHQNRFISVQMNNFLVPNITNNMIRNSMSRNQFQQNFCQNSLRKLYHHKVVENMSNHCSMGRNTLLPEPRQRFWSRSYQRSSNMVAKPNDEVYHSSFKVLPGVSSWSELKTKWREEKTITIDDEDTEKDKIEDNNEIQVVGQIRNPLIGPKSANSLEEVFSKLKIIKSAPEKIVRRKKNKYKISYNVYSNAQNYRKANPGHPLYRIVVVRQDDPFIQPLELHRLVQDAGSTPIVLACVSMSISYIQPGYISVHNFT